MAVREQMGFFDRSGWHASLDGKEDPLVEKNDVVPWEEFRPLPKQDWRESLIDADQLNSVWPTAHSNEN